MAKASAAYQRAMVSAWRGDNNGVAWRHQQACSSGGRNSVSVINYRVSSSMARQRMASRSGRRISVSSSEKQRGVAKTRSVSIKNVWRHQQQHQHGSSWHVASSAKHGNRHGGMAKLARNVASWHGESGGSSKSVLTAYSAYFSVVVSISHGM